MTNTLYRFVKASERLPDTEKNVFAAAVTGTKCIVWYDNEEKVWRFADNSTEINDGYVFYWLEEVKEADQQELKAEIDRLKGLIWKLWELKFYATAPLSVHEGVMDELYKRQKEQFKTENNL